MMNINMKHVVEIASGIMLAGLASEGYDVVAKVGKITLNKVKTTIKNKKENKKGEAK